MLLGHGRGKERDVFLVDFGLVSKYERGGVHLEYKPDPRKMHDGTIEYASRDAHIGVKGRRSDLEVIVVSIPIPKGLPFYSFGIPLTDHNYKFIHLMN